MALGHARVVEVARGVMHHAQLRHDPPGFLVAGDCVCNDLRQLKRLETKSDRSCRGFWRVATAPECPCDAPTDFDSRREMGLVADTEKADRTHEGTVLFRLDSPEAVAVRRQVRELAVDPRVSCLARRERQQLLHYAWVSRHFGEGLPVRVFPGSQDYPLREDVHTRFPVL